MPGDAVNKIYIFPLAGIAFHEREKCKLLNKHMMNIHNFYAYIGWILSMCLRSPIQFIENEWLNQKMVGR